MARHVNKLSHAERIVFAEILHGTEEHTQRCMGGTYDESDYVPKLPTNGSLVRRLYVYPETYAFKFNLPHPQIYNDVSDHSYLLISDCLADYLGHGLPTIEGVAAEDTFDFPVSSPFGTKLYS